MSDIATIIDDLNDLPIDDVKYIAHLFNKQTGFNAALGVVLAVSSLRGRLKKKELNAFISELANEKLA